MREAKKSLVTRCTQKNTADWRKNNNFIPVLKNIFLQIFLNGDTGFGFLIKKNEVLQNNR